MSFCDEVYIRCLFFVSAHRLLCVQVSVMRRLTVDVNSVADVPQIGIIKHFVNCVLCQLQWNIGVAGNIFQQST